MKKIITKMCVALALLLSVVACDSEYTTYSGPNYIMFPDTMYVFPVQNSEDYFEIPIAATQACDYDRTFAVEVVEQESNAIEGRHYLLEQNTVTIKAGELVGKVRMLGFHENIDVYDSLGVTLNLLVDEKSEWDLYGTRAQVELRKACPFDINAFTGYCLVTSTYIINYLPNIDMRLIRSEVDPEQENTIIMRNYFYDGYDLRIEFETDDILNPIIKMKDQKFASTAEAFGTIYGDGYIMARNAPEYISYYSSCEKFIFQYMTLYVPGMAEGSNVVGTFMNAVEWISDDEAALLMQQGY
ncbi:MAG: DUF4984 domain-containing protein [Bacteroidaceae bacterium]|nr:DUF4984 domain-containing protein [Bacteroidaceae bacterium]